MTTRYMAALMASSFLTAFSANTTLWAAEPVSSFPSKEIRLVVPWNAGGSNDIAARALAQLAAEQGVRVIVENVPGATGSIGMTKVANAEPDGYMIGMGTSSTLALMAQNLTPLRNEQFAPIARVTTDPLVLLVPSNGPATTLESFISYLKKNPGKVSIGTPGSNNLNHIFAVMTGRAAGVDVIAVPYTGGSKVVADLAGKQIEAAVLKPSESKALIDGGLVKPIAVFANERLKALPDVPTFKEKGFDVFPYGPLVQMAYIVTPAATPAAVRERLIAIFSKAIQSAKFKTSAEDSGAVVDDHVGARYLVRVYFHGPYRHQCWSRAAVHTALHGEPQLGAATVLFARQRAAWIHPAGRGCRRRCALRGDHVGAVGGAAGGGSAPGQGTFGRHYVNFPLRSRHLALCHCGGLFHPQAGPERPRGALDNLVRFT